MAASPPSWTISNNKNEKVKEVKDNYDSDETYCSEFENGN